MAGFLSWHTVSVRQKPYWIKGGVLAIPISILLVPLTIYIAVSFGAGDEIIQYVAPEIFVLLMGFGMSASPISLVSAIISIAIVAAIFAGKSFVIGAALGMVYEKFAAKGKEMWFWPFLLILYVLLVGILTYRTQDLWKTYASATSPQECESVTRKGVDNFNVNECYRQLAERNKDVKFCEYIDTTRETGKSGEDYKAFCYEEVAHAKNDPSVCALIPEITHNEHGVENYRRDGCYRWFNMCEYMTIPVNKDSCFMDLARLNKNRNLCSRVTGSHPAFTEQKCLEQFND